MNTSFNNVLSALFLIAPQFVSADPTVLANYQALYNLVSCQVNSSVLSCCGVMVFAFLMAHYLTIAANQNIGMNSNMTEGQLSIGFNVAPDMTALNLTPYGRSYIDLIQRTVVGTTVTNLPLVLGGVSPNIPFGIANGNFGFGAWPFAGV
jgi:hypothetical protein